MSVVDLFAGMGGCHMLFFDRVNYTRAQAVESLVRAWMDAHGYTGQA